MAMEKALVDKPYTDEWWFKRLFETFFEKQKRRDDKWYSRVQWADYLWNWYEGNPPAPQHTEGWQAQVTKDVLRMGVANLAMLAVESKLDRVQLLSFRATTDPSDDDQRTGAEATARKLMRKYSTVFDDALLYASVMTDGYIWCGPPGDDGLPTVTAEDPRACVTIDDPVDPTRVVAALKMYRNVWEKTDYAHVVLPPVPEKLEERPDDAPADWVPAVLEPGVGYRIRVATRRTTLGTISSSWTAGGWEWNDELSKEYPVQRGTFVHHVRAPNGINDIETVIPLLERINNMIVDRLWISKFQAFRQRAMQEKVDATNGEAPDPMPTHDEEGNEIDWDSILSADPGAVWRLPAGMTIWESTPTDMQGVLSSVKDDIKEFAAVTRTPIYVFTPDAVSGSATGASLAREGQVFKAEKWMKRHSPVFLAVCADMLALSGHEAEAGGELELKWGPAERVTMSERASAGVQAKSAGVPLEGVWEDFLQATPETMERYRSMASAERAQQLLLAAAATVPTRPADVDTPPPATPPAPSGAPELESVDALAAAV